MTIAPGNFETNEQQVREIAETAFKARFADIPIVSIGPIASIGVKSGFDHDDAPLLDVKIVYDGEVEQLIRPRALDGGALGDHREGVGGGGGLPGWPQVHLIAKSDLERPDPAAA